MNPIDRFLGKITKQDKEDGCWQWTASRTQQGYGMFSYQGKSIPAHRFSYLHHKGEITTGYIVHQTCGQNSCVNPDHLIICTKSESRLDYNSTRVHPDTKKFTCTYDEWKSVYDGDLELRKQFMKDDIVGKVDENTAMIKATITNPEKMEKIMSERIPEIAPKLGLEHEMYTLTKMNNN
mgnify:CR=1 FL=1